MNTNVETTNNNDISTNNDISQLIAFNKLIDDLIVLSSYVRNKELITKDKLLMKLMYEVPNDKYAEAIKKDMLNKINVVEQVDSFYKNLNSLNGIPSLRSRHILFTSFSILFSTISLFFLNLNSWNCSFCFTFSILLFTIFSIS